MPNSKLQVYKCSLDWCQSAVRLLQGNEPPQLELHRGNEREEEVPGPEVLDLGQRGLQDRDALGHVDQHSRYILEIVGPGTLTLILKGEISVRLTSLSLLVRARLF